MANEIYIRVGSDLPQIQLVLSGNGALIDLTDATGVRYVCRPRYTGAAFSVTGGFGTKTNGEVIMDLQTGANQFNTYGPYLMYANTLWSGGRIRSFPSNGGYYDLFLISGLV